MDILNIDQLLWRQVIFLLFALRFFTDSFEFFDKGFDPVENGLLFGQVLRIERAHFRQFMETQKTEITQLNFRLGSELNAFLNLQQGLLKRHNSNSHRNLGDPNWERDHVLISTIETIHHAAPNTILLNLHCLGLERPYATPYHRICSTEQLLYSSIGT